MNPSTPDNSFRVSSQVPVQRSSRMDGTCLSGMLQLFLSTIKLLHIYLFRVMFDSDSLYVLYCCKKLILQLNHNDFKQSEF